MNVHATIVAPRADAGHEPLGRWRPLPVAITLAMVLLAAVLGWVAWNAWVSQPWTRDGRVRVYVVAMAPEVSGRIAELRVRDNQFVRRGDVLLVIDPADYVIAVQAAEAAVRQATADLANRAAQNRRRQSLTTLSTSIEEQQTYLAAAQMAQAALERAQAQLAQARINLERTQLRSPVNGWVTNLLVRQGDYATTGQRNIAIVDADSFWVDGYFEETALSRIRDGDRARVHLMGYGAVLHGRVDSVSRGIQVSNAQPDGSGLAMVNPIFTWVRLAQRVPVRVQLDPVPEGVRLVGGTTATIEIDVGGRR